MGSYSNFSCYYYNYYCHFFFKYSNIFSYLQFTFRRRSQSKFVVFFLPITLPGTLEKFIPLHWLLMLLVKWEERPEERKKSLLRLFVFFLLPFSRSCVVWTGSSSTDRDRDRWFIIMLLPRHKPLGESSDRKSRVNFMCCRQREKVFFWGNCGFYEYFWQLNNGSI